MHTQPTSRFAILANIPRVFLTAALLVSAATVFAQPAKDAAKEEPKETLRVEVGKPLQAAQELIAAKKYPEALLKVREADAIAAKTAYEQFFIDRMFGAVGLGMGDNALAAKSLEAAINSGKLEGVEKLRFLEALTSTNYRIKEYTKAAQWGTKAMQETGVSPDTRLTVAHSLYLTNDFAGAARELATLILQTEAAGKVPTEDQLRILASSKEKQGDMAGYLAGLEKLLAHYPSEKYWADAIYRVESKKTFAERFSLDAYRLKFALGLVKEPNELTDMAELAMSGGYAVEAQKVLVYGYSNNILGKEGNVAQQKKLRDTVAKEIAEDKKRAPTADPAKGKTGQALINNGLDQVLKGDFERGLAMMQQGVTATNLKRPDDEKLRLGIAQVFAAQNAKAVETFKTVQGADGAADLARLWTIYANRKPAG